MTPSDFPVRYVFAAAWRSLDNWVKHGLPGPHAAPLQVVAKPEGVAPDRLFILDAQGNALGGVRSPYVDVPTARWITRRL